MVNIFSILQILVINPVELALLKRIVIESLHHLNTCQAVFNLGINFSHTFFVDGKNPGQSLVSQPGNAKNEGHESEHREGQAQVDGCQDDEAADEAQALNKDVLGQVMRQFTNRKKVVGNVRHQVAHAFLVKKRE